MSPRLTLLTAGRVLRQLRADHRTMALMLVVPCLLIGLLAWVLDGSPLFDRFVASLLGVFPFVVMFIVTSIATLRGRTSGTLERLLTTPLGKADFLVGYAVAFGVVAVVQAVIATAFSIWVAGLDVAGSVVVLVVVAAVNAVVGTFLGLLASAFARTEFQAVQFMPAFVLPQFLLCGLIVRRDSMPQVLQWVSDLLPLSYAVDGMQEVAASTGLRDVGVDVVILIAFS
jgi:ABC-2 type transport system permease protein